MPTVGAGSVVGLSVIVGHILMFTLVLARHPFASVARTATLPPRCGYPHAIDVPASLPPAVSKAAATPRIVAVSDIHGQYDLLLRLLRANKVIDADDNWALGRDQLVIAGDVFDRGGAVNETLSRLYGSLVAVDPKAASEVAERWSKDHPGDLAVGRMLAEGHVRRGDLAAARTQFEKLRQLAPKDAGLVNDLANVLIRLKDPKALEVAEQALAAAPNSAAVIDTAGWAALQAGKLDRALQLLRDARLRDPDSRETRYHLAAALVKSGRKAEAKEELDTALRGKVGFDGREDAESLLLTLK